MKQTLLSISLIILISCNKSAQEPQSITSQSQSELTVEPKIIIDSIYYDAENSLYDVWIIFKGFECGDIQTIQYISGGGVVYSIQPVPAHRQFVQLYTRESGATGIIDIYFVRDNNTLYEKTRRVYGK